MTPDLAASRDSKALLDRWAARYLFAVAAVITSLKLIFAQRLDLYSDEVFYWLESTRPALAYSDLPFVSALLAGLGPALFGHSPLAVRLPFLIIGMALPALIYWLTKPIQGAAHARQAALLSLCLPLAASLGLLAVPDVPLIALGLLSVALYLRAQAQNHWSLWLATGVVVALGLCTHYRFGLFPLGVALSLVTHAPTRLILRNPRAWVAALVACLGFIPIVAFNLGNEMASAAFYFQDRHPWEFSFAGLKHIPLQALITTPVLYGVLLAPFLSSSVRRELTTNSESASFEPQLQAVAQHLLLTLGALHLGLYAALAPWSDATSTTEHWPLAGYFILLPLAPRVIELLTRQQPRLKALPALTLGLGMLGTALALFGLGSQSLQSQLQPLVGLNTLSTKMAGWSEFSDFTQTLKTQEFDDPPLIASDNYYTAAQLGFAEVAAMDRLFTLDQSKAFRDGRAAQLRLWQADAAALSRLSGEEVLFITEDSTLNVDQKTAVLLDACSLGAPLELLTPREFVGGAKRFSFYRLTVGAVQAGCPLPAQGWIDDIQVAEDHILTVSGWAFAPYAGVAELRVEVAGLALSGDLERSERADVAALPRSTDDPHFPQIGFSLQLDGSALTPGTHSAVLVMTSASGEQTKSLPHPFNIGAQP